MENKAQAIYQKRNFTNRNTGEIVSYDFYGIRAIVNGEQMELKLENLSPAEKQVFKMIAYVDNSNDSFEVTTKKTSNGEGPIVIRNAEEDSAADDFFSNMKDDEDE